MIRHAISYLLHLNITSIKMIWTLICIFAPTILLIIKDIIKWFKTLIFGPSTKPEINHLKREWTDEDKQAYREYIFGRKEGV